MIPLTSPPPCHWTVPLKSLNKGVGSEVGSGSEPDHLAKGADPDPDPHRNVTDRQHCALESQRDVVYLG
jgi:hypothetical protein